MTRDKWRLRSPCCDSVDYRRRSETSDFYCKRCRTPFEAPVDAKTGESATREVIQQ